MFFPCKFIKSTINNGNILKIGLNSSFGQRFLSISVLNQQKTAEDELSRSTKSHYDVIIVGGGTVGLSLATAFGTNPKLNQNRVLVLDAARPFTGVDKTGYSNRVFALSGGTVDFLKSIDCWKGIEANRCQPVKQMQMWDSSSDSLLTFNHDRFSDNLAYIVENDVILESLIDKLTDSENISLRTSSKIDSVRLKDAERFGSVTLSTGEELSCDLLIGADGANSLVRKQMDVNYFSMSYNQMGVIATVQLNESTDNHVAWQRFLPNGVIALLPLSDQLSSIVWSTSTDNARRLLSLQDQDFIDELNDSFMHKYPQDNIIIGVTNVLDSLFGSYTQKQRQLPPRIDQIYRKSRAGFPLGIGHAASYVDRGVVLVGDAAHRVHPLAGQGLNLGFGDVKTLIDCLAKSSYNGAAIDDFDSLRSYERQRLTHNVPIIFGIHAIQQLYDCNLTPIVLMRTMGVQITQALNPLKTFFIRQANL